MEKRQKKILSFRMLRENWDGYGAYPLEIESASNAINFVASFSETELKSLKEIYPNPHGTISFEWVNSMGEELHLEIGNKVMSYYTALASDDIPKFFNEKETNFNEFSKIKKFLQILG